MAGNSSTQVLNGFRNLNWASAEVFVAEFESALITIEAVKDILTTWYSPFLTASLRGHREHLSMSGDITIMKADFAKPATSQLSLLARNWMSLWSFVKEKPVSLPFPRSGTTYIPSAGSILKMEVAYYSETLVSTCKATQCQNPEYHNLSIHFGESLKTHKYFKISIISQSINCHNSVYLPETLKMRIPVDVSGTVNVCPVFVCVITYFRGKYKFQICWNELPRNIF